MKQITITSEEEYLIKSICEAYIARNKPSVASNKLKQFIDKLNTNQY